MEIKAAQGASIASMCPLIMTVCSSISGDIPGLLKNTLLCSQVHFFSHPSLSFSSFSGLILPPTGSSHYFFL